MFLARVLREPPSGWGSSEEIGAHSRSYLHMYGGTSFVYPLARRYRVATEEMSDLLLPSSAVLALPTTFNMNGFHVT